jgi:hypothetical protein
MNPLFLILLTGVGLVLANTAVMLALDASARTVAYPAEEMVPHHAMVRRGTSMESHPIEAFMEAEQTTLPTTCARA